jgi:hypothetical protein
MRWRPIRSASGDRMIEPSGRNPKPIANVISDSISEPIAVCDTKICFEKMTASSP